MQVLSKEERPHGALENMVKVLAKAPEPEKRVVPQKQYSRPTGDRPMGLRPDNHQRYANALRCG